MLLEDKVPYKKKITSIVVVAIYSERWNFAPNYKKKNTFHIHFPTLPSGSTKLLTPHCQIGNSNSSSTLHVYFPNYS